MNKILVFLLLFVISFANAQKNLKPVRLGQVTEAWLAGERESCISQLQKIYESDRTNLITVYNLGYLNYLQGNLSQALKLFSEAKLIDLNYPYSNLNISKIYEVSGNLISAKNILLAGLKTKSDNYQLQIALARIYYKLGETAAAIEQYLNIIDDFEEEFEPKIELAAIYRQQKNFKAVKNLLEFDDNEYPSSSALIEKYRYFRDSGQIENAKEILINICSAYPRSEDLKIYQDTLLLKYHLEQVPEPEKIPKYNYIFDPKEKLNYMVEYGFLKLGWLKVRVEDELIINGRKVYRVVFYIDSNPDFDFVIALHHIYESYIDAETLSAVRSRLYTPDGDDNFVRMYYFDYDINKFHSYAVKTDGRYEFVEKNLPNAAQDGTSMLYLARGLVSNKSDGKTVVVINEKFKYAIIDFLNEIEEVEVKDKDVNATKIFAQAKFSGVAGMNGDAYGWFSNDNQSMPLQGEIKIIIGSITVMVDDQDN
ncbi:DUF3108 domain-containing protein [Calditrichota bacterium]